MRDRETQNPHSCWSPGLAPESPAAWIGKIPPCAPPSLAISRLDVIPGLLALHPLAKEERTSY
ncbi:hypothetical protein VFPPC_18381 [Pochonia chlamydosporia 170]|uniref:Uncharacterized protein n=1 Tax=Pochonia chlamydosporia 170 TaxID=1380566 RepID=A0A219ANM1_METCM|nr:hypothetical protein VFPPC_18381 [Pochonia chlamydosporia 170]OWT42440.1 hypothetical protein VFPPC_18381 [Pochonia chlamydosporia 170]